MGEKTNSYKYRLRIPDQKPMRFLKYRQYHLERDILAIANSIFNVERKLREGKKIDRLRISIDRETLRWIIPRELKNDIEEVFERILFRKIKLELEYADLAKHRKRKKFEFEQTNSVCLFSGGLDSYSGILNTERHFKDTAGVFIAHSDQSGVINITNKLIRKILIPNGIDCKTIYAPRIGSGDYSQLRGLLYFLSSSIYLNLMKTSNLIITETGPTMYQPRFAPYDSVTMTTHPLILSIAKNVIENLLNKKINIITPFENLTKSEVITNSPKKEHLSETHSCITERFRTHDGTCYGCVIRRIAFICAGVKDVDYMKDPFIDNNANNDNLMSLMRFNYDILTNYKEMPYFSKENVLNYDKLELFKRFSLDTFCALNIIRKKHGKLADKVNKLFLQALDDIGEEEMNKRIEDIRSCKIKPNFETKVK